MLIPSDEDAIEEIERVVEKFLRTHADKYQTTAQATRQCGLLEGNVPTSSGDRKARGVNMKVMLHFLRRLVREVAGEPATEWAILLMLVAAVAGLALFILGDALYAFYSDVSENPFGNNPGLSGDPGIAPPQ